MWFALYTDINLSRGQNRIVILAVMLLFCTYDNKLEKVSFVFQFFPLWEQLITTSPRRREKSIYTQYPREAFDEAKSFARKAPSTPRKPSAIFYYETFPTTKSLRICNTSCARLTVLNIFRLASFLVDKKTHSLRIYILQKSSLRRR